MFPTSIQVDLFKSGLGSDLLQFIPELVVCTGIVLLLLIRLVSRLDRAHLGVLAVGTLAAALFAAIYQFDTAGEGAGPFFGGMLIADPFAGIARCLVLLAALLTAILTLLTDVPDRDDSADFHTLLLGGTLGMMLMTSANHLMMVFIAVEMASLPGYALAGFMKGKKTGSEAALKYVVYGAGASGIMLYGMTLVSGTFGTGYLPNVAAAVAERGLDLPVVAGFGLILVGLGFKLAAVPFHFWCPDVFEGAPAEVAGFLSVASKAAAIILTSRVLQTLQASQTDPWVIRSSLGLAVGVMAAITVTFGNLAAFGQSNVKRLLAYSTIAHAGYMLLAVAVITPAASAGVLYYLAAYIVMNLGAFAVVAFVRNATGSETLDGFRGLARRQPVLAVTMTLFLLSLLGLPPLAGFAGKFQVFVAVYEAAKAASASVHPNLGTAFYVLLGIGVLNTAVSAYYYLKVVRVMVLEEPEPSAGITAPGTSAGAAFYLSFLAAALFVLGIVWNPLVRAAEHAAGIR